MSTRKPNILVVSDPPVAPGYLPRVRFLCDYLARKGYGVTLLTEDGKPLTFTHAYSNVSRWHVRVADEGYMDIVDRLV